MAFRRLCYYIDSQKGMTLPETNTSSWWSCLALHSFPMAQLCSTYPVELCAPQSTVGTNYQIVFFLFSVYLWKVIIKMFSLDSWGDLACKNTFCTRTQVPFLWPTWQKRNDCTSCPLTPICPPHEINKWENYIRNRIVILCPSESNLWKLPQRHLC